MPDLMYSYNNNIGDIVTFNFNKNIGKKKPNKNIRRMKWSKSPDVKLNLSDILNSFTYDRWYFGEDNE